MQLDQGEELHAEPELRPVSRSAEGERLDAARAEFRAEWQAKIDRKRGEVERARRREARCENFCDWIYLRGLVFGGGIGGLVGLLYRSLFGAIVFAAAGALAVGVIVVPLLVLGMACKAWFGARAQRLEQELRELGRVELPREARPDIISQQDLRPVFTPEWQAKIQEKRHQEEMARRRERWWNAATWKVFYTGASTSVLLGLFAAVFTQQSFALATPLTVYSALLTIPFMSLASFCEWRWKKRAELLEQKAQELEQEAQELERS